MNIKVCKRLKQYFEGLLNVSEEKSAESTAWAEMTVEVFEKLDQKISTDEA